MKHRHYLWAAVAAGLGAIGTAQAQSRLQVNPAPSDAKVLPGTPNSGTAAPPTFAAEGFVFNNTMSLGSLWRTQPRDFSLLGIANGGTGTSSNWDNGNLNFDQGLVLGGLRGRGSIAWSHGPFEALVDGVYFANGLNSRDRSYVAGTVDRQLSLGGYLNDAWVGAKVATDIGAVRLRAGNQILRWNETSFSFGAQVTNPQVFSRIFLPGAGLADSLKAVPMITAAMGGPGTGGFEAFYKLDFAPDESIPCGFFLETNDYTCPGSRFLSLSALAPDGPNSIITPATPLGSGLVRGRDRVESTAGQFGINIRSPDFGGPLKASISLLAARFTDMGGVTSALRGTQSDLLRMTAANYDAGGQYIRDYRSGVGMLGAAFRASLTSTTQIKAEYSIRLGQPVQVDDAQLIGAFQLPAAVIGACSNASASTPCQQVLARANSNQVISRAGGITAANAAGFLGQFVSGADYHDVSQFGIGVVQTLPPILGASEWFAGAEFGGMYVHDYNPQILLLDSPSSPRAGTANGTADPFSGGYRLLTRLVFKDLLGLRSIAPALAFQHDVAGFSPVPLPLFLERTMRIRLNVDAAINERLTASLTYVSNITRSSRADLLSDRDYVLTSLSYRF
ncbi:DUF1302 family protein [Methylobacterium sp. 88A]|uniref:DUF1302 domain-containing protein n=1 Tax=Methylobacterium sp. 88A TaxID=1131813 RepID=UPI0003AAEBF5|nr:DUF1302 family protein [Methylobacterium sp. 88A]